MAQKCFISGLGTGTVFTPASGEDSNPALPVQIPFQYVMVTSNNEINLTQVAGQGIGEGFAELDSYSDTFATLKTKAQNYITGLGYTNVTFVWLDDKGIL